MLMAVQINLVLEQMKPIVMRYYFPVWQRVQSVYYIT